MSKIEDNEYVRAAMQIAESDLGRELTPLERELIVAAAIGEAKDRALASEDEWRKRFDEVKAAEEQRQCPR